MLTLTHDSELHHKLVSLLSNDNLVIFLFHGVIDSNGHGVRNYTGKHIQKSIFENCIKALSKNGFPISMDEVYEHISNKVPFPKKSYAISFDDGFENNMSVAAPILDYYKTPAIIYTTTDFIENNRISWIDKIEYAVQNSRCSTINLDHTNLSYDLTSKINKIKFLGEIRHLVKTNPKANHEKISAEISEKLLGYQVESLDGELDKKMSWEQVNEAHNSDFLCIGGHSHSHPILSYLSEKELKEELDLSLSLLEKKANVTSIHYSYPEGLEYCFNNNIILELKKRGIKCCPTAIYGTNNIYADLFGLNRIMVG